MKMKNILAGVAASALAVTAMAASASAVDIADYFEKNVEGNHGAALYLVANDGKAQWAVDAGVDITTVCGVRFYVTFDAADVADEATWLGGAVVANSNSTGWKQVEWGRVDKEITADLENGTVTWQNGGPIFAADDEYAQLWLVDWSTKKLSVDNIEVLDKDGNVITGEAAPEATEAAPEETAAEASSFTANLETALYVGENVTWTNAKSDSVTVTGAGDYTYSISGLDLDPSTITVIYAKDVAVESGSATTSAIDPINVSYKSLKINGEEVAIKDGAPSALSDAGVFDFCLYNIWSENFIELPSANINSIELTISVNAASDETEAPAAESETEAATEAVAESVTEAPAETTAPVADTNNTPASDKGNADTGIEGVAVVAAIAVLAGGAVVIAKKRK